MAPPALPRLCPFPLTCVRAGAAAPRRTPLHGWHGSVCRCPRTPREGRRAQRVRREEARGRGHWLRVMFSSTPASLCAALMGVSSTRVEPWIAAARYAQLRGDAAGGLALVQRAAMLEEDHLHVYLTRGACRSPPRSVLAECSPPCRVLAVLRAIFLTQSSTPALGKRRRPQC